MITETENDDDAQREFERSMEEFVDRYEDTVKRPHTENPESERSEDERWNADSPLADGSVQIFEAETGRFVLAVASATKDVNRRRATLIITSVNSYASSQRVIQAATDLSGFLNITPLRLNEDDAMTLSMLQDELREALAAVDEENQ